MVFNAIENANILKHHAHYVADKKNDLKCTKTSSRQKTNNNTGLGGRQTDIEAPNIYETALRVSA